MKANQILLLIQAICLIIQLINWRIQVINHRIQKANAKQLYQDFVRKYGYPPY